MVIHLGLVGLGKIARDQHLPAIERSADFKLAAIASRNASLDGVACFHTLDEMLAQDDAPDAIALCQPPQQRFGAALAALRAGKHVFLEKPPGATLSEVETLVAVAREQGATLFASWHSRCAPAVEPARDWLKTREILKVTINWKEDVRHWHPGQNWIWQAGGMGVFDPGINALSIATAILPSFHLASALLEFPVNCDAPIAADLSFQTAEGVPIDAAFDFRQTGPQSWDIEIETMTGTLLIRHGGADLYIDGVAVVLAPEAEYARLYERFAMLITAGESDVDLRPLRHVADAFMLGKRVPTEAFVE